MPNYIIAYHGGKQPSSKKEGMLQMVKWQSWIESLGDAIVNAGTPLKDTKIVTADNVENDNDVDAMKGFAVIKADNIESAVEIVKSDPFIENAGTIRVSQMLEMQ